jgi:hypothetical protein
VRDIALYDRHGRAARHPHVPLGGIDFSLLEVLAQQPRAGSAPVGHRGPVAARWSIGRRIDTDDRVAGLSVIAEAGVTIDAGNSGVSRRRALIPR